MVRLTLSGSGADRALAMQHRTVNETALAVQHRTVNEMEQRRAKSHTLLSCPFGTGNLRCRRILITAPSRICGREGAGADHKKHDRSGSGVIRIALLR